MKTWRRWVAVAALVSLVTGAAACGGPRQYTPPAAARLDPEWRVADSLKVFNAAVKILVTDGKPNERYYQLIDTVTAGEVKAHVLEATDWVVSQGVNRILADSPTIPRVLSAGLVSFKTDCVVARVLVDYTTQVKSRDPSLKPQLASYFAVFKRDPSGPDPLKLNPRGWRWEQFIRQETGFDEPAVRVEKKLKGQPVRKEGPEPYNACYATAGLADDCLPPAPQPPFGTENDLGKAVVAFLACPVPDIPRTDPSPFSKAFYATTTTVPPAAPQSPQSPPVSSPR